MNGEGGRRKMKCKKCEGNEKYNLREYVEKVTHQYIHRILVNTLIGLCFVVIGILIGIAVTLG